MSLDFDKDDFFGKSEKLGRQSSKSNFMDDIFGKKSEDKDSKFIFLDDIPSGDKEKKNNKSDNEFVLDSRYKKSIEGNSMFDEKDPNPQLRRRRGNPELQLKDISLLQEDTKKEKKSFSKPWEIDENDVNSFPWMAKKSDSSLKSQQMSKQQHPPHSQVPQQTIQLQSLSITQPLPTTQIVQEPAMTQNAQPGTDYIQGPTPHQPGVQFVQGPTVPQHGVPYVQETAVPLHCAVHQPFIPDTSGLYTKEIDMFNKELEQFNKVINQRKAEQAEAMKKQREQLERAIVEMQDRHMQVKQHQAEQGKLMLTKLQQQMEEEAANKQRMLINHLQMMSRMNTELTGTFNEFNFNEIVKKLQENDSERETGRQELKDLVNTKVSEMKEIFAAKEDRIIDNYEHIVKDLENKLDLASEKYRQTVEDGREEKENLIQQHKKEILFIKENHMTTMQSLKDEYMLVIERIKELRKVEMETQAENSRAVINLQYLASNLDKNSREMSDIKGKVEDNLDKLMDFREIKLMEQEQQLKVLQETMIAQQNMNEKERERLMDMLQQLRREMVEKQAEIDQEKRDISYERRKYESEKNSFQQEKETLLEGLSREKRKFYEDRDKGLQDIERMKIDLQKQKKEVDREKCMYYIHKRINPEELYREDLSINREEIEGMIKAVEYEKDTLRGQRETLRKNKEKIHNDKNKLETTKRELVFTVEKLLEVERGLDRRCSEMEECRKVMKQIQEENNNYFRADNNMEDKMLEAMEEIEESLVELMKTEQRIRSEKTLLSVERKNLEKLRIGYCKNCAILTRAVSAKDLRYLERARCPVVSWQDAEQIVRKPVWLTEGVAGERPIHFFDEETIASERPPIAAWMDIDGPTFQRGKYFSRDNFINRASGDGASFEALDQSTLSVFKEESQNDHKYLKNEKEYLKSVQRINMKTVNKYQNL